MEAIILKIIQTAAVLGLAMFGGAAGAWAQAVTTYASGSAISDPEAIAFDGAGNLYVANYALGTIAKVAPGGACLSTPASSVPVSFAAGSTATFSIFVKATGAMAFDPGASRIFVRFKDSGGTSHGSTSVAVRTQ